MSARLIPNILFIVLFGSPAVYAQGYMQYLIRADSAFQKGNYEESARLFVTAISLGADQQSDFYFAAGVSFAMCGNTDSAFFLLDQAIRKGSRNLNAIQNDSSFAGLWTDPRWHSYFNQWTDIAARSEKGLNKPLQDELLRMADEDQEVRKTIPSPQDSAQWKSIIQGDRIHAARLKEIVRRYGWPGKSLVGEKASHMAWLLVQHADFDRDLQDTCLALLSTMTKSGDANPSDLAYLTDRVLINKGEKQIYGTQTRWVDSTSSYATLPIADEANVDRRRSEVGLAPISEYLQFLNRTLSPKRSGK